MENFFTIFPHNGKNVSTLWKTFSTTAERPQRLHRIFMDRSTLDLNSARKHTACMKTWMFGTFFLFATLSLASPAPEEARFYFSPSPAQPEQVRTHRDIVQWRLAGELFDEGPCLEGVPFPILVGTTQQIAKVHQMLSTPVQTFGPVRGYREICPQFCSPAPAPGLNAINITNGYHNESDVAALLTQFETNFPALAQKIQIGTTIWGRPIWALKISDNVATEEPEPRVAIDANIHSREFAPPEVALDIIWQLLYGYTTNTTFASWVDGMEIYVIPCLNPDGRYFCDTISTSWRKNGRDNNRNGTMAYPTDGVDLNRNSSFHWGSDDEGSTSTPADDTYRGPQAASEPEIQAYDAFLQHVRPAFTLTLHSYEGSFYSPYGDYNVSMPSPDPFKPLGTNMARICTNDDNSAYVYYSGPEFSYTVNGDRTDSNYGLYGIQAYGAEIGISGFQPTYATTRDKLVPGLRPGWQKFLAAAYTNWPKVRGWSLDATTGQPAPVRIHSLNLTNRPNDEHWTSRSDGYFECPLPTAGTYRLVFSPLGQSSLATTQTVSVGASVNETNLVFSVAPVLVESTNSGTLAWSNQNENGTAQIESAETMEGTWLPLLALAATGRTGQVQLPGLTSNGYVRVFTSPRRFFPNTNMVGSNMVYIPSGHFQMGADQSGFTNEQPAAAVYIDAFAIDVSEITYSNWFKVRRWAITNGYFFATGQCGVVAGGGPATSSNHPVVKAGWHDAVKWCNARSQFEGLLPAYYTSAAQTNIYKSNTLDLADACVNWNANGYRLPTEAEWEKAARGGFTAQEYPWGNSIAATNARYASTGTTNVSAYPANGIGLRDAAGNVSEWCWDWSGSYSNRSATNPTGPATGTVRVVRGGSWSDKFPQLRCAYRDNLIPSSSNTLVGFRCVRR